MGSLIVMSVWDESIWDLFPSPLGAMGSLMEQTTDEAKTEASFRPLSGQWGP